MKISCQSCGAKYNIADEKVRGKIVKIACKKCGARIEIDGREAAEQVQDQDETRVYDQAQAPAGGGAETWTVSVDDNDQRESTSAQIAELLQQGVINADTFVWRDGMADWLPIRDVPELASALSNDGSSSGYAASQPPPAQSSRPPEPEAPIAPVAYPAPQIETTQAARLGGSRRGGAVDLFATQAAPEDEDVATSAPSAAAAGGGGGMFGGAGLSEVSSGKPIGARNENSVLFSLSALTASGPSNAPAASVGGDDEKSGLIDIQKLAASAKPGGKGDDRAKLDDIMNLGGGGAFGAALGAPILAPPPATALEASTSGGAAEEKKGGKGMLFVVIGLAAAVVVLVLVLVLKGGGGDDKKEAAKGKDDKSETKKEGDKTDKKDPAVGGDPAAKGTGTDSPPDPGAGGPIGQPGTSSSVKAGGTAVPGKPGGPAVPGTGTAAAASTTTKAGDPPAPGAKPGCKSLEECMGSPKPGGDPPKDPPKAGGAEFDKGAATASLKAVPYKDCGSGGAGKVSVTFSPSGSVSGASVTAGDYDSATKSCIAGRFRGAKVPAFSGDPKSVGWSINL